MAALSSPQLHSKDFLSNKRTILTEDDVLHYRRLSLGGESSDDSSSNGDDYLLGIDLFVTINQVDERNSPTAVTMTTGTASSSTEGSPFLGIRGTVTGYDQTQSWIYFPTGWSVNELCSQTHSTAGVTAYVNGRYVTLYHIRQVVYCSDQKCPHAGGPLDLGEIEEVPGTGVPCIVCPWHRYCFNLETGQIQRPSHRQDHLQVYPTRIEHNGLISIGFESFDKSYFLDENF